MKALLITLALALSTTSMAQLEPSLDPGLELIESEDQHIEGDISCSIGILSSFSGTFQQRSGAQGLCNGFDSFCSIRQFGNSFYESNYRRRVVFRGRGGNHQQARRRAFDLYFDFIDRGRFFRNRFGHQFVFSKGCSS